MLLLSIGRVSIAQVDGEGETRENISIAVTDVSPLGKVAQQVTPRQDITHDSKEEPLSNTTESFSDIPDFVMEYIFIGNPGNMPDSSTLCGSVTTSYGIGKYPVTAAQYCTFLNAVATVADTHHLYDERMALDPAVASIIRLKGFGGYSYSVMEGCDELPITYVNLFSAMRFCNWLENGNPLSVAPDEEERITETGTYTLNGDRKVGNPSSHTTWYLPSENEWYKAAYHKGGSASAGYWSYPTQSDFAPQNHLNMPADYQANYCYNDYAAQGPPYLTRVGYYSLGPYGTYDMGGNVAEWTATQSNPADFDLLSSYVVRGGSWNDHYSVTNDNPLCSKYREGCNPLMKSNQIGFRVARAVVEQGNNSSRIIENFSDDQLTPWQKTKEGFFKVILMAGIAALVAAVAIGVLGLFISIPVVPITGAALAAGAAANQVTNRELEPRKNSPPLRGLNRELAAAAGFIAALGTGLAVVTIGASLGIAGSQLITGSLLDMSIAAAGLQANRTPIQTVGAALAGSYAGRNTAALLEGTVAEIATYLSDHLP
ncbi:MAG TPA: SUMF1/EgtB/PvdO family nonheme iron enzyme [Chthoniobacterales bacterium]|nr:SUMF1/EgtB/PvdO family nonheme iron enzyme [Chthoniobacterales bacterium]